MNGRIKIIFEIIAQLSWNIFIDLNCFDNQKVIENQPS